jgi:hypothetical protein
MKPNLLKALKMEIEVYKNYLKEGKYDVSMFDPRNSQTCFMGQGFMFNSSGLEGWTDTDLAFYRKSVGTIAYKKWGECTILEIWAGDHFKDYQKMVTDVFKYCWGERKTLPKIDFYINPFYQNSLSGKWLVSDKQKQEQAGAEHLMKLANYMEIKKRMEKSGAKHPMELEVDEKDDPIKGRHDY